MSSSTSSQSSKKPPTALKLDPKKGQVGGLKLGDTIAKVLTYIQLNV